MRKRLTIFFTVAVICAAADLATKAWAEAEIQGEGEVEVTSWLNWRWSTNRGAAFGMFDDKAWGPHLLTAVSIAAAIFIVVFAVKNKDRPAPTSIALGLILGGVIGNVYDRVLNDGHVRDFIDFHVGDWHWHTFNIADSGISVGVVLLLLLGFLPAPKGEGASKGAGKGGGKGPGKGSGKGPGT